MPVNLEIVSPEKLLLSRAVEMVVIPASEGDMGVLEGHAPMIVLLRGGAISLYEADNKVSDTLFVAGGFAEVTPERCTVLANEVMPIAEASKEEGERRLAAAESDYAAADPADTAAQELALERQQSAQALIDAAAGVLTGSH